MFSRDAISAFSKGDAQLEENTFWLKAKIEGGADIWNNYF